jgi:hypothetical protein
MYGQALKDKQVALVMFGEESVRQKIRRTKNAWKYVEKAAIDYYVLGAYQATYSNSVSNAQKLRNG